MKKMVNHRNLWAALMLALGLVSVAAAQASVNLSATPASHIVTAGNTATYNIKLTRNNYTDKVTLAATGLPAGATATFTPNPVLGTGTTSTLKITTAANTPAGAYNVKITGTATGLSSEPLFLALQVKPPSNIGLTTDAEVQCIMAGQTATYAVDIQRTNFDGPVTFSAGNAPAGVTAFFEPATTSGNRIYFRLRTPANAGATAGELSINAQGLGVAAVRKIRFFTNCGLQWTAQTGSSGNENPATPGFAAQSKITPDSAGNVYVTGSTTGGMEGTSGANAGSTDVYLSKYDAYGNRLWTQQFGGTAEDRATEVKADNAGNVYVAGYTAGAIDPNNPAAFGNFDVWVARFDANGNRLALKQFGDSAEQGPYGLELQPTANGVNVFYVTGRFGATVTKHTLNTNLISSFNSFVRVNTFRININEIAVGADGSFAVAGHDGVFDNNNNTEWGAGVAAKFDANGNLLWSRQFGVYGRDERANRVALDAQGNVFVAGCRLSTVARENLDNASCSNAQLPALPNVNEDAWVKKLSANGASELWERTFATPGRDVIGGIETASYLETVNGQQVTKQGVYLAGSTEGVLVFNAAGGADMWLARYETGGNEALLRQFGSAGQDRGLTLAVDNSGYILASGTSDSNFGGFHQGGTDVWIVKYAPGSSPYYINNFTPASGPAGTQITLNGNFGGLVTEVRFGGVLAQFTRLSSTQIRATVPVGAISGRITVSQLVLSGQCPVSVSATNFIVQ